MVTTIEPVDNEDVTQKELEEELKEYYRECDKLLFISLMLALKEPLPEGLDNEEYTKENALEVISKHIEELEKLVSEFNSPVGYLGLDLKSSAVILAMALIAPEARKKIVKQLLVTYNEGQSEKNAHQKFYTFNLDRCVKLVYAYPDISRDELPLLSTMLRYIAANPNDTVSGPFLTIRSLVDLSKVEFKDLGSDYRNLLREEIEMAKKATSKKTTAKTQVNKISEVVTTTEEVEAKKQTIEAVSDKQETTPVPEQKQTKVLDKEETEKSLKEEKMNNSVTKEQVENIDKILKESSNEMVEKIFSNENLKEASNRFKDAMDEFAARMDEMHADPDAGKNVKNVESWTKPKKETSTLTKVLIGAAGIAAVGGLGYLAYDKFFTDNSTVAFDNGMD